ncbi:HD domain-containing phosphohydrolase [Neptuniibacter sp. QD48_11]|uniref:HD domain-containing protein n=1 Tax=unclassified Neptuniibacter TaxID=2630693 RepID=UPI0039F52A80
MPLAKIISANSLLSDQLVGILAEDYQLEISSCLREVCVDSDLVLLDHDLVGQYDESELVTAIQQYEHLHVPVILVWNNAEEDYREFAIEVGCSDYLRPPFFPSVVNAKCKTYISLAKLKQNFTSRAATDVPTSAVPAGDLVDVTELLAVQDAAILCLATIARIRDHSTGNHILRTQHYVKALAEHLYKNPAYHDELDAETIELYYKTSALHDIGKVGIPDHILQKPGELTAEEYRVMKTHTVLGYQAVTSAQQLLDSSSSGKAVKFLELAQQVTLSHHERWDGEGYPQGLKGENIPLIARLMAVADVYDAMISRRPYKNAVDHERVTNVIVSGRGSHFDPAVVDAFLDLQDMFERISFKLEDVFPSSADLMLHSMSDLIAENDLATAEELAGS